MATRKHGKALPKGRTLAIWGVFLTSCVLFFPEARAFIRSTIPSGTRVLWPDAQATLNLRAGCPQALLFHWGPCWDDAAVDAAARWNNVTERFRFSVQSPPISTDACNHRDGINTVTFAFTICGMAFGDAIAVTAFVANSTTGALLDTDVLFASTRPWSTYPGPLQRNPASGAVVAFDFHRVAIHEFGHVLGLGHPDEAGQSVTAIMNSSVSNLDGLQQDDMDGVNAIYSSSSARRLINISTRGFVGTGDNVLIGGFIIEGSSTTVLIRVPGPSLAALGVSGVLLDPTVELFSGQTRIAFNDNWQTDPGAQQIPAVLRPSDSREAALFVTLAPGAYTVIVRGVGGATGVTLVEVFVP